MDAFQKFPHFIDTDIRTERKYPSGYTVSYELMIHRHQSLLPKELVENRTVLDIGCCVGSTGAWVLDNGATKYTGIELQKNFAEQAEKNLLKCFPTDHWEILNSSLEDFLEQNTESYDIVFAGGVMHTSLYYQDLIKKISKIAKIAIVVESITPKIIFDGLFNNKSVDFVSLVEYTADAGMVHEHGNNLKVNSAIPSLGSLCILFREQGFEIDMQSYIRFKETKKTLWPTRFGAVFVKETPGIVRSTQYLYDNNINDVIPWKAIISPTWKFDENVAKSFGQHARQHIPDYDKVIDLSIKLCKILLKDPLNDRILDVGCAIGETISRLYTNGCCNLIGVDSSQAMLDQCDQRQAFYVLDKNFPKEHGLFDAILCNWTLHFIENKEKYLQCIYEGLNPGGFVIITDKTQDQGLALDLYHEFKKNQGVSDEEIQAKAQSVKNMMFINSPDWYIKTLESLGFIKTDIINAAPCFTSFVSFRPR